MNFGTKIRLSFQIYAILKKEKKKYIGVDPGTNFLGYAVIEIDGQVIKALEIGVVTMAHLEDQPLKLKKIFERLSEVIDEHKPTEMAVEAPFFGKNVQSMLKLGRAQGVAIAAGMVKGLEVTEYSPKKIKQSVTGKGASSKEQVASMLETILKTKLDEHSLDATDALAAAVCHHFQSSSPLGKLSKKDGWAGFIKANPGKVAKL
jgi:crossover junction endodeoxyribonuclease RuvC